MLHNNPFALIDPDAVKPKKEKAQPVKADSTPKKKKSANKKTRKDKSSPKSEGSIVVPQTAPELTADIWEEIPPEAKEEVWQEIPSKKKIQPPEPTALSKSQKKNLRQKEKRIAARMDDANVSGTPDSERTKRNTEATSNAGFKILGLQQPKLREHHTPNSFSVLPIESPVMERNQSKNTQAAALDPEVDLEKVAQDEAQRVIESEIAKDAERRRQLEEQEAQRRAEFERREKETQMLQQQLQAKRAEEFRLQQEMERSEAIRLQIENKRLEEEAAKKATEQSTLAERPTQPMYNQNQLGSVHSGDQDLLTETLKNLTTGAPAIPASVNNVPKGIYSPTTGRLNRGAFYKPGMVPGPPPGFAARPPPGFENAAPAVPAAPAGAAPLGRSGSNGSFDNSPSVGRAPPGFDTINTPSPSLSRRAPPGFDRRIAPPGFETAPRSPSFSPRSFTQYRNGSSLGPSGSSENIMGGFKGRTAVLAGSEQS